MLKKWADDMEKLDRHHEAMTKGESNRFLNAKKPKDVIDRTRSVDMSYLKKDLRSPVMSYIKSEGAVVDSNQLGASMGPVMSRNQGLKGLK